MKRFFKSNILNRVRIRTGSRIDEDSINKAQSATVEAYVGDRLKELADGWCIMAHRRRDIEHMLKELDNEDKKVG